MDVSRPKRLEPCSQARVLLHTNHATMQEIANEFSGKKTFSILDLKDGYWQIQLMKRAHCCAPSISHLGGTGSPECPSAE